MLKLEIEREKADEPLQELFKYKITDGEDVLFSGTIQGDAGDSNIEEILIIVLRKFIYGEEV